jgi:dTDP-4-dehydrorhamnose reductase
VDDQWGVPTHTGELARQILGCIGEGSTGVAHTVGGGGPITWFTFAEAIVSLSGLSCGVEPCTSEQFPRPARRPTHAWLNAGAGPAGGARHWLETLKTYLSEEQR